MDILPKRILPYDLTISPDDTQKQVEAKLERQREFERKYREVVSQTTMAGLLDITSRHMKEGFFASLFFPAGYCTLDNPQSKKLISKLHTLGMLTDDSDVFQFDVTTVAKSHPDYFTWFLKQAGIENMVIRSTDIQYSTQYGYVSGFIHKTKLALLPSKKVRSVLPSKTTLVFGDENNHGVFVSNGDVEVDESGRKYVVVRTDALAHDKKAPAYFAKPVGTLYPVDMRTKHHPEYASLAPYYEQSLMDEFLQDYRPVSLVDHDFQQRKPMRAFETMVKVLKSVQQMSL